MTSELLKTSFASYDSVPESSSAEAPSHGVSLVPLGSRKQLCINEKVRALARNGGDERMNEACLDMQKSGKSDKSYQDVQLKVYNSWQVKQDVNSYQQKQTK